jgi:2-polyprenyl-6-methoxyphenol hydroxylase-like FAD-dependent oxidoreductase
MLTGSAGASRERRRTPSTLPRATSVSTRSMELLRTWGLEAEIRAGGIEVEWMGWVCETLATASPGVAMPTGYPTREQAALISPTAPACVPQHQLEPVLLRRLRSLAAARVHFRAPLWDLLGEHRHGIYAVTAAGAEGAFASPGRATGGSTRWSGTPDANAWRTARRSG